MIWESTFPFNVTVEKCTYRYVMDALVSFAQKTPDKKVLISAEDSNNFMTFAQLIDQIRIAEAYLQDLGFQPGEVATVVMSSSIEIVPFYIAVLGRGGIYSGMSPMLTEFEIHRQLSNCKSIIVFTSSEMMHKIKPVVEKLKTEGSEPFVITIGETNGWGSEKWETIKKTKGEAPKRTNHIHDVAVLPYSSGTTGMPKGVQLSHYNLMSAILSKNEYMVRIIPQPSGPDGRPESILERTQVCAMPMYHMSGKFIIISNLIEGTTTVVLKSFDLRVYLETIQRYKIYNLTLSPPVLLRLVKDPMVKEYDLSSVGYVTCGAAPLGPELANEFFKMYPNVMLTQAYGMSECVGVVLPKCDRIDNFATAGCVAPGFKVKIVDVGTGEALAPNQTGEILINGPGVMVGYLNRPEATAETIDKDRWLHSGDIGYMNENGELFVVDRIKEMIKVNGLQVAPAEIESVLASDSRISDVGVVGIQNPRHGEVPCAFIVKSDPTLNETDVLQLIKERVADFKWPEGVIKFVERIPKNPTGKILRRDLRKLIVV